MHTTTNLLSLKVPRAGQEMLNILSMSVPLMSIRQISCEFYHGDRANSARSLRRLKQHSLLRVIQLIGRTPPFQGEPLVIWKTGNSPPSFGRLAAQLERRWRNQPVHRHTCFTVGERFCHLFGYTQPKLRQLQVSHDLGLSELYLRSRHQFEKEQETWVGEIAFAYCPNPAIQKLLEDGGQKPDAIVLNKNGEVSRAIEFGGFYTAKRLERFHRWCQRKGIPYEIW